MVTFNDLLSYVSCETPKIIVNPRFKQYEVIPRYDLFVYPDRNGKPTTLSITDINSFETALKYTRSVCQSLENGSLSKDTDSEQWYYLSTKSGEVGNPFLAVTCGHCDLCISSKKNDYCQRASFQLQQDCKFPFFFTLTYNDEHNPKSVDKPAILQFIKKFKTYYRRYYGKSPSDLKFLITSEYGSEKHTFRPHYHCLLFGFLTDYISDLERYNELKKLSEFCWLDGRRDVSFYDFYNKYDHRLKFLTDDKAFRGGVDIKLVNNVRGVCNYVLKYICKDLGADVPAGLEPNFKIVPYKFGTFFFESELAQQIFDTLKNSVKYLDKFTNQIKELHLSRYFINRLFPCVSQLLPHDVKTIYQYYCGFCKKYNIEIPKKYNILDCVYYGGLDNVLYEPNYDFAINILDKWLFKHNTKYNSKPLSWFLNMRNILFSGQTPQPVNISLIKHKICKEYNKTILNRKL